MVRGGLPGAYREQAALPDGSQLLGDTATVSSSSIDDCPILESARPTLQARLDLQAVAIGTYAPALDTRTQVTPSAVRPHSASTVFERWTLTSNLIHPSR